jgi:hypothetical protein
MKAKSAITSLTRCGARGCSHGVASRASRRPIRDGSLEHARCSSQLDLGRSAPACPLAGVVRGEREECGEEKLHGQRTHVCPEIVPGCLDVGADQAGRTRQLTAQGGHEFIPPERCAVGNQERGAPCGRGLLKPSEPGCHLGASLDHTIVERDQPGAPRAQSLVRPTDEIQGRLHAFRYHLARIGGLRVCLGCRPTTLGCHQLLEQRRHAPSLSLERAMPVVQRLRCSRELALQVF